MTELSSAQHGIWFTELAGAAAGSYHVAMGIQFGEGLDEKALDTACAAVIERHPVLRSAVTVHNGEPSLEPAPQPPSLVYGGWTIQRVAEEVAQPFGLDTGPLIRFTLLSASPDKHLLLIVAHHLVFDGVSKDILARDLALAYGAAVTSQPASLGEPLWPAAGTGDPQDLAIAREYWQQLPPAVGRVILPFHQGVPSAAGPGGTVTVTLPVGTSTQLGAVAQRIGVTRFELLLAAVHTLLARYGNAGLPVSVTLSTRDKLTAEQIGLFVNELPLAVAPTDGTFDDYARSVRERLRGLYRVRTVALTQAIRGLRPTAALTEVSVSYRRQHTEPAFANVGTHVDWTLPTQAARNTLNILIVDASTGLRIDLQHSRQAMSEAAAEDVASHFATLLDDLLADPGKAVTDLAVLPPAERERVLNTWNHTARTFPAGATVMSLFGEHLRAHPGAAAVTDAGTGLSYADLDRMSGALARQLRARGVEPGQLVAVSVNRSWQALVTLLAVMRCGAAYVPVDPAYPPRRRELILADANHAMVIDDPVVTADLRTDEPCPEDAACPDGLAYVMYTSGSTGAPKGVCVSHRALVNLLLGMGEVLGAQLGDRWLALTSLSFDISGLELFLPLVTGGTVVVASGVSASDGAAVSRLVRQERVTHVQATPSGWRALLDGGFADISVTALAGGETLTAALARELRPRVGRLFNVYGPTETTIWSTVDEVSPDISHITIGRPVANTRVYVLDEALNPVAAGTPGELYIGGTGVAEGYLNQPELTAQRFVGSAWGRIYRTGDICRWTTDGRLVYVGRADNQIKLRGHRIEPGEVEARLREHPSVADAAVSLRDGADPAHAFLTGYVVTRPGAGLEVTALRQHLSETLPSIMVPAQWMRLERLPRTPNGKLDRGALPEPYLHRQTTQPSGQDSGQIEAGLLEIWRDVLQVDDITPEDDLFDLGGHSLSITRIAGRIVQRFEVEVPFTTFFETPTVAAIAAIVRAQVRRMDAQS